MHTRDAYVVSCLTCTKNLRPSLTYMFDDHFTITRNETAMRISISFQNLEKCYVSHGLLKSPCVGVLVHLLWKKYAGLSSLSVPGVQWHTQYFADQLTPFQPEGTNYAHLITTGTPGFSDLPTALVCKEINEFRNGPPVREELSELTIW